MLPEVDVENLHCANRSHGVEELVDGRTGNCIALCEGAEADSAGIPGNLLDLRSPWDVVISDPLADIVLRDAIA